eukprot:CAMPEP_0114496308 /NCGR_PEP_ID=MMETSP0109-20121206/5700_1 /TAXON_ID=29199 /ORGANISM="Chlorarachnion reptans, Strain CCCM449" /LENGTH=321 /DNA_ID=CAMNT_0001673571 /DNA_START=52 /DNA_END=1017 /DNA_ORIENTATION=+
MNIVSNLLCPPGGEDNLTFLEQAALEEANHARRLPSGGEDDVFTDLWKGTVFDTNPCPNKSSATVAVEPLDPYPNGITPEQKTAALNGITPEKKTAPPKSRAGLKTSKKSTRKSGNRKRKYRPPCQRKRGVCPVCNKEAMIQDLDRKAPFAKLHKCVKRGNEDTIRLVRAAAAVQKILGPIKGLGMHLRRIRQQAKALRALLDRICSEGYKPVCARDVIREIKIVEENYLDVDNDETKNLSSAPPKSIAESLQFETAGVGDMLDLISQDYPDNAGFIDKESPAFEAWDHTEKITESNMLRIRSHEYECRTPEMTVGIIDGV